MVVVHPFAESIKNQYDNYRDKIFEDPKVLPTFSSFRVVKAVQSLGGESNFETWFEALDYMKKKLNGKILMSVLLVVELMAFH